MSAEALLVCVCSIMKLFALLPLLVLTLLQGTLATHLETYQCDQVRKLVNSTVYTGGCNRSGEQAESPHPLCCQQHQHNGTGESEEQTNWYHGVTPYTHTATTRLPLPSTRQTRKFYRPPCHILSTRKFSRPPCHVLSRCISKCSIWLLLNLQVWVCLSCQSVLFHESDLWQSDRGVDEGGQYRHEEQQPHLSQWIESHLIS